MPPPSDAASPQGLALINAEVTRQAATLAYLQDFRLMMFLSLAAIPMIVLLRTPAKTPAEVEVPVSME
jgi:MFS transporter, DHA2 family, multidrug resistance protein